MVKNNCFYIECVCINNSYVLLQDYAVTQRHIFLWGPSKYICVAELAVMRLLLLTWIKFDPSIDK